MAIVFIEHSHANGAFVGRNHLLVHSVTETIDNKSQLLHNAILTDVTNGSAVIIIGSIYVFTSNPHSYPHMFVV